MNEELLKDDEQINSENESDSDDENKTNDINETEDENDDDNLETETETDINNVDKNKIEEVKQINHREVIDKKNRISRPYLTKYEYVRCLGERTQQIMAGAKVMIKNADELLKIKSPKEIAKIEIKEKCCPYIIVRPLPNNKEEHWDINELEILFPI